MALIIKYRPQSFAQFLGHHDVVEPLKSFLKNPDTMPQTILFHGIPGCGKTTLSKIISGVLKTRSKFFSFKETNVAAEGTKKVTDVIIKTTQHIQIFTLFWMIEEFDALSDNGQQALLKALEEPPANLYFALCTNHFHEVIAPIRSRAQCFELGPLSDGDILKLITHVACEERIKLSRESRERIIYLARGVPREALKLLERCPFLPPADEPAHEERKGKVISF